MFKYSFMILNMVHGAIHLMGFIKAYNYANIKELTCFISKPAGVLWLLIAASFAGVALMLFAGCKYWWLLAMPAVFISEALIISCFKDAKFGTIPNIIIFAAAIVSYGLWNFENESKCDLDLILNSLVAGKTRVTAETIADMPPVMKKWFGRSNLIGKEISNVIYLTQRGILKTEPDGEWMPVTAKQWSISDKPEFLWIANIEAAPLIHITGRDKYYDGRGRMLIELMSLFKAADSTGNEIDQGALLRYLGESVFLPSAFFKRYIKLEQLDEFSVKATMNYAGTEAFGIYKFNAAGDFVSFEAKRYYARKEGATLEDWLVTADPDGYKEFGGVRAAAKLAVTWKLKTGDFTWYKFEVDNLEYGADVENCRDKL